MKKIILPIFLMLIVANAYCQRLHFIKLIHVGIEQKPIGTIVISVEKPIIPNDRIFDDSFGRSIQTDMRTFTAIEAFIKLNKHVSSKTLNVKNRNFKIIDFNNFEAYISYKNTHPFAHGLQKYLRAKNLDRNVINAFDVDFY